MLEHSLLRSSEPRFSCLTGLLCSQYCSIQQSMVEYGLWPTLRVSVRRATFPQIRKCLQLSLCASPTTWQTNLTATSFIVCVLASPLCDQEQSFLFPILQSSGHAGIYSCRANLKHRLCLPGDYIPHKSQFLPAGSCNSQDAQQLCVLFLSVFLDYRQVFSLGYDYIAYPLYGYTIECFYQIL